MTKGKARIFTGRGSMVFGVTCVVLFLLVLPLSAAEEERTCRNISCLRVAVIGAGPAGCAVMRAFAKSKAQGREVPEIAVFDKQGDIGGMWRYTNETGVDQYG